MYAAGKTIDINPNFEGHQLTSIQRSNVGAATQLHHGTCQELAEHIELLPCQCAMLALRQMNQMRRCERWLPSRCALRTYLRPFSAQFDPNNPLAVLSHAEDLRVDEAKQRYMQQWYGSNNVMNERNHHYNRSLQGLEGPNALGVHLSYAARIKFLRGGRGKWGLFPRPTQYRDQPLTSEPVGTQVQ
eukprot:s1999_g13.t1